MPHRRVANSTPAIVRLFKTAAATFHNTPDPADIALPADVWVRLDDTNPASLGSSFIKEASDVDIAQAAKAPLTTALSFAAARLVMFCSHFHQVLDMAIARGEFAVGARSYYGRDVNATTLPKMSYDDLEEVANNIVQGEANRATAEGKGYKAMGLPSAADVAAALGTFTSARNAAQQAEVNTDKQREDVSAMYEEAYELGVDIYEEVEHFYRKDPEASSRRAKCRRWGIVYLYDANEPVDSGDQIGQKTSTTEGAIAPNESKSGTTPAA